MCCKLTLLCSKSGRSDGAHEHRNSEDDAVCSLPDKNKKAAANIRHKPTEVHRVQQGQWRGTKSKDSQETKGYTV